MQVPILAVGALWYFVAHVHMQDVIILKVTVINFSDMHCGPLNTLIYHTIKRVYCKPTELPSSVLSKLFSS